MFPIRDENPTQTIPWVTNFLLGMNLLIFGYELSLSTDQLELLFRTWGFVPAEFGTGTWSGSLMRMISSMFLHGGILHVGGNMLFLWVFGDNIEDELGHGSFFLFYLFTGIASVLGQYGMAPDSQIPMVGASGAISGIMGAYFLLYPGTPVLTIVILFIFVRMIYLPAWIFLGYWFLIQFLSGTMAIGAQSMGGVAWFAHIGGFVAGIAWVVFSGVLSRPRR